MGCTYGTTPETDTATDVPRSEIVDSSDAGGEYFTWNWARQALSG